MNRTRRILRACIGATSIAAVTACTTLPDTSGYTAASYQLKASATAAGDALHTEVGRSLELVPESQRARGQASLARFDAAWDKTVKSLDGLARYAESIEELTKAGNGGGESARGIAQSVSALADMIGIVPGAQLAGVATDTFVMINTAVANIRASRSLKRSLEIADPVIEDMAGVVAAQLAVARGQFDQALDDQRVGLEFSVDDIARIEADLAAQEVESARRLAALSTGALREAERNAEAANLERIRRGRAALAPRMTAYHDARAALAERARAGRELFAATETALVTWRESHGKVVRAIRDRQPVNFASLMAASEDIKDLIERWRDL